MTYSTSFHVWLTETDRAPARLRHPLVEELRAMANLQPGWSYGHGRKIADAVISKAADILEFGGAQLHLQSEVFPGREGEVAIAFHNGDRCVQITVNPDLTLGVRVERGHGFQYEDVIDPIDTLEKESEAYSYITRLVSDDAWKSPASSTSSTLVEYGDGSSILPLRTPAA